MAAMRVVVGRIGDLRSRRARGAPSARRARSGVTRAEQSASRRRADASAPIAAVATSGGIGRMSGAAIVRDAPPASTG